MVYCELCDDDYSETEYLSHLDRCIKRQQPFTENGDPRKKATIVFDVIQRHYGYKGIIRYLNSPIQKNFTYREWTFRFDELERYGRTTYGLNIGGWVPFLYSASPEFITEAYIQAIESDNEKIVDLAHKNIKHALFLRGATSFPEVKKALSSFLYSLLKDWKASKAVIKKYRQLSEQYQVHLLFELKRDIERYGNTDDKLLYSELNREHKPRTIFLSDSEIFRILHSWRTVDEIMKGLNFHGDEKRSELKVLLDKMVGEKKLVKEKRNRDNGLKSCYAQPKIRGIAYVKSLDKRPSRPKSKSKKSDFEDFLKGQ